MCVYFSRNNVAMKKRYDLHWTLPGNVFHHFFNLSKIAIKDFDFDFDLGKKYHIQRIKRIRQDIVVDFRGSIETG
jgi:hypothetical protein